MSDFNTLELTEKGKVLRTFKDGTLIVLALLSLFLLVFEMTRTLPDRQILIIHTLDIGIALVFLSEFVYRLVKSKNAVEFINANWWQLLAAIPVTTVLTQALRTLVIIRFVQVVRFASIAARLSIFSRSSSRFLKETRLPAITSFVFFVMFIGSVSFYSFEVDVNPSVSTYFDSFWYSAGMITNSGSGDIHPVTEGGRLAGIFLMFSGVVSFGVLTAFLASYLVKKRRDEWLESNPADRI
jgi:voltage-gated potassium channel